MVSTDGRRSTSVFSAPVFAAIVFWGDPIDLAFGSTFAVHASMVSIVAARTLLQTIFGCSGFALSMTGRHVLEAGLLGIGLMVSVALCFALIQGHGQIGPASFPVNDQCESVRCCTVCVWHQACQGRSVAVAGAPVRKLQWSRSGVSASPIP
jgi:hypothetical protein